MRPEDLAPDLTGLNADWLRLSAHGAPAPARPAPTLPPAERIGPYEILGELGRGGMGVVYKARDARLGRVVALKMLLGGGHSSPDQRLRFHNEASLLARLTHPNIVQVYEAGEHNGQPYFAMEHVEGERLDTTQQRPPAEAALLIETLARAVHHAHTRGVLHRDLKPQNVLLAADGTPKVADFGIARALARAGEDDLGLTRTGQVLGTPAYIAPELLSNSRQPAGPAADVYSLGVLLYELLAGRPPFPFESLSDLLFRVTCQSPPAPSQFRPGIPRDLETVVLRCLEREPYARYPSAQALADDLRNFLEGRPVLARPIGALTQAWRWARRNPLPASLLGAVALLGVALVVTLSLALWAIGARWHHAEEARARAETSEARAREALHQKEAQWHQRRRSLDDLTSALFAPLVAGNQYLHEGERRFLEVARDYYSPFADDTGEDAETRLAAARASGRLGTIHRRLNEPALAERRFREAAARYQQLWQQRRDFRRLRGLASARGNLGAMLFDLGRDAEARAELTAAVRLLSRHGGGEPHAGRLRAMCCYFLAKATPGAPQKEALLNEALSIQRELARHGPSRGEARGEMARTLTRLGETRQAQGDARAARDLFEEALALWAMPAGLYARPESRELMAGCRANLSICYQDVGLPVSALREASAAVDEARRLADAYPGLPEYAIRLATCENTMAVVLRAQKKPAEALAACLRAASTLEAVPQRARGSVSWKRAATAIYWQLAFLHGASKDYEAAIEDCRLALLSAGPEDRPRLLDLRLMARFMAGRHRGALQDVDNLLKVKMSADQAVEVASRCAQAATRDETPQEWREPYARAAIRLLEKAREAGYFQMAGRAERLKQQRAFAALRGRPDWRALWAQQGGAARRSME